MSLRIAAAMALIAGLGACSSSDGGVPVQITFPSGVANFGSGGAAPNGNSLPFTTGGFPNGLIAASKFPASVATTRNNTGTFYEATPTSLVPTDASPIGGISFRVEGDAAAAPRVAGAPDLIQARSNTGDLLAGGTVPALVDAEGTVTFTGQAFGQPSGSNANGTVEGISVFGLGGGQTLQLRNSMAIRYAAGSAADGEVLFGTGFAGAPTGNMPTSGTVTYTAAHQNFLGMADLSTGLTAITLNGDARMEANFNTGMVNGGLDNLVILAQPIPGLAATTDVTSGQTGFVINGTIERNAISGFANFVDANGDVVGTMTRNEVIGGFFGNNAREIITAYDLQGAMPLEGTNANFILQGTIAGAR